MTLTEFLNARLNEDEARATASGVGRPQGSHDAPAPNEPDQAFTPARLLAEVKAKRLLIRLAYEATGLDMDKDLDRAIDAREASGIEFVGERMLRALALPYADHADYSETWRL
ncbi:DUF6221 family protein [Isoptericola sp. NPDC057391]|uniref:DUF6221 family protein n=1 Tax=Isoptericola sp. NPDC057391 TaxID=3346117 RepID=UPI00363E803B